MLDSSPSFIFAKTNVVFKKVVLFAISKQSDSERKCGEQDSGAGGGWVVFDLTLHEWTLCHCTSAARAKQIFVY